MPVVRFVLATVAAMVLACTGSPAWPDSWFPATVKTYLSSDGDVRFTVTPRDIEGPLAYFKDKVEGVEPAGHEPGRALEARGKLERRGASDQWEVVWDRPLLNDVSPVSALVAADGGFVVTFDNWHSVGWGDDAVVIYDAQGDPVRAMALTDFLPQPYFEALPRTVSSIWWGGDHRITDSSLILQIVVPTDPASDAERTYVEITVDLPTGSVRPPEGVDWERALAAARVVNAERAEAAAKWRAERIAPLLGPAEPTELAWHQYLREAFYRLHEGPEEYPSAATKVLRSPTAGDYAPSLRFLREALIGRDYDGNVMIGSMSESNLADVLIELSAEIPAGSLAGNTLYIAVRDPVWPGIETALRNSGADIRQLDPTEPIPQRPERMPR